MMYFWRAIIKSFQTENLKKNEKNLIDIEIIVEPADPMDLLTSNDKVLF